MKFAFFIAKRFMLGGKGAGPSRMTGWISIIGLAAGTFALIISLSVLNGFEERVTSRVIGFEGDIRITAVDEDVDLLNIKDIVIRDENVKGVIPYQERKGLVSSQGQEQRLVTLKAIPFNQFSAFYDVEMESEENELGKKSIFIGQVLSRRLNVQIGDEIQLMSPVDHSGQIGLPRRFTGIIAGIFRAEVLDMDDRVVFIPLSLGQQIFTRKKVIDGIDVRLTKSSRAKDLKKYFRKKLPGGLSIKSWADLHAGLFNAMRMERLGTMAVLSLIVLVACFNLMSTLVLITFQKIREIGILITLGTTSRRIQGIILFQGLMIGGLGALAGMMLSSGLIFLQNSIGLFPLPEDIYFIDKLPMVFKMKDGFAVACISFAFVFISSMIASNRTLQINPKEAVYLEK